MKSKAYNAGAKVHHGIGWALSNIIGGVKALAIGAVDVVHGIARGNDTPIVKAKRKPA